VLGIAGVGCRQLDAYAYAPVDVDAEAGAATVSLRNQTGTVHANFGDPGPPRHHAIECAERGGCPVMD
jgi:hypothetical protein